MSKKNTYRLFGVAPATSVGARINGLVALATGFDCGCCDGLVRVAGNVISQVRNGGPFTPETPPLDSQISAVPFAKLSISTSDGLGRTLIDADSQLIIPSRLVCGVEVIGPPTWGEPGPASSATGIVWDVHGQVQVCKADDGADLLGRLTEFQLVEALATTTFIRPRGARRVQFFSQPTLQFWELWAGAPTVGQQVGEMIVPANSMDPMDMMPGVTHIRNVPRGENALLGLVWEIAPP